jgi:hypothetical protein
MTETTRTQKESTRNWPYPPKLNSMDDVRAYLIKLYVALSENRDKGFAGEIFLSSDQPQDFVGKDGDLWVKKPT